MDEQTLSRLFEPYFTTKEVGKGTGLGLAMVYGIIKQSGGHINVTSTIGRGTRFEIWLPVAPEAAQATSPSSNDLVVPVGRETILVVEDEEVVRTLTCRLLSANGYQVLAASHAEEALKISRRYEGTIHLLLTDIIMPGPTGPELARRLLVERPDTRVLYMSGYPNRPGTELELLHGDERLLVKPFTAGVLLQKVRDALGASPSAPGPVSVSVVEDNAMMVSSGA